MKTTFELKITRRFLSVLKLILAGNKLRTEFNDNNFQLLVIMHIRQLNFICASIPVNANGSKKLHC